VRLSYWTVPIPAIFSLGFCSVTGAGSWPMWARKFYSSR